jgi:hypothetical protein
LSSNKEAFEGVPEQRSEQHFEFEVIPDSIGIRQQKKKKNNKKNQTPGTGRRKFRKKRKKKKKERKC